MHADIIQKNNLTHTTK